MLCTENSHVLPQMPSLHINQKIISEHFGLILKNTSLHRESYEVPAAMLL